MQVYSDSGVVEQDEGRNGSISPLLQIERNFNSLSCKVNRYYLKLRGCWGFVFQFFLNVNLIPAYSESSHNKLPSRDLFDDQ